MNEGLRHRVLRLQKRPGVFRFFALDHGLTIGISPGSPNLAIQSQFLEISDFIDGIVLTYGLALSFAERIPTNLILQCFGAPKSSSRIQLASAEVALRLGAMAVAVQLDLGRSDLSEHTREISRFVTEAHSVGLPVLFMASGFDESQGTDVANTIRICHELGANWIKVRFEPGPQGMGEFREDFITRLGMSPPVVLAGGAECAHISELLGEALKLGFSGYCIGRSIFESHNPVMVARELDRILTRSDIMEALCTRNL